MSLKVGIVGLPNVGKSTLFSSLTKNKVDINNYPFCTIQPNVGIATVSDERLDELHTLYPESKKIPAIIEFVDIAGLVKNAHKGEGLGNQFLANIRNVDAIVEVVRAFPNLDIEHTEKSIDPLRDIGIIHSELILADLELIQRRKSKVEKLKRSTGEAKELAAIEWDILEILEKKLNEESWLYPLPEMPKKLIPYTNDLIKNFSLLTTKPILYAINISETQNTQDLKEKIKQKGILELEYLFLDAKLEIELNEISSEEQKELGVTSNLDDIVRHSYKLLDLLTFFTSGDKETRAWETKNGASAPEAAGVIHSDFQKLFISANVINFAALLKAGSWKNARENGLIRREGKDYPMQEGDVAEFVISK